MKLHRSKQYFRIAFLILGISSCGFAQQQLTHIPRPVESSQPDQFFKYGDKTLFTAYTAQAGRELWITDGTASGTFMLKDITQGQLGTRFFNFVVFKNEAYFVAENLLDQQLWKTNGTSNGTVRVSNNVFNSVGDQIAATGKYVFFTRSLKSGLELWRSDGTTDGTVVVNPKLPVSESPLNMMAVDDALFFTARSSDDPSGTSARIWTSDGSIEGTKFIGPPIASSIAFFYDRLANHPRQILYYKGALYFIGLGNFDGVSEVGLMKSEITGGAPVNIKGIVKEDIGDNELVDFVQGTIANNKLYIQLLLSYPKQLIIVESDGTTAGTNVIFQKSFNKYFCVSELMADQSNLYFTAGNDGGGISLMKIDLNSKVAAEVKELAQGSAFPIADVQGRQITGFIRKNPEGKIIIYAPENESKASLWGSDGTTANTFKMVTPTIYPSYRPTETMLSGLSDGQSELWLFDGTSVNGKLVKDVEPGGTLLRNQQILPVGHLALTVLNEGSQISRALTPWITDGSFSGTHAMPGITPGIIKYATGFQSWGDRSVFVGLNNGYYHLYGWNSNKLDDLYQFSRFELSVSPLAVTIDDQALFFTDVIGQTVSILKVVKGSTTPETVKSFGGAGQPYTYLSSLTGSEKYIYFFVSSGNSSELWRSDGTSQGTTKVQDVPTYSGPIIPWNDKVITFSNNRIFVADDQTKTLVQLTSVSDSSFPIVNFVGIPAQQLDNTFLFLGQTLNEGFELWSTDGTPSGTKILKDIAAGPMHGMPVAGYINDNGKMYFTAVDTEHGAELWVTDGTTENTNLVKDIVPGASSSTPRSFFIHKDKIVFSAWTPGYGEELWYTDGTAAGTGLYADIIPGPAGSLPALPCSLDDQVIFFATTPDEGEQLFSFAPPVLAVEQSVERMKAYPNPTTGMVYVETTDADRKSIELLTMDGRHVSAFEQSESYIEIDMRQQPDGLYILKVAHQGRVDIVKVVKH